MGGKIAPGEVFWHSIHSSLFLLYLVTIFYIIITFLLSQQNGTEQTQLEEQSSQVYSLHFKVTPAGEWVL